MEAKRQAEKEKGEPLTIFETVKVEAPYYGKAAISSALTLGLMAGSEAANRSRIRTLEATCTALMAANTKFERVIDYPREEDDDLPPWEGPQIFNLSFCECGQWFEVDEATYEKAKYEMNRRFRLNGWVNPYDFPGLLGFPDHSYYNEDAIYYDYCRDEIFADVIWIDFIRTRTVNDDGLIVNDIDMIFVRDPRKKQRLV